VISAHCGSQALGPALRVPSPGALTSPLPLGSVSTEIASIQDSTLVRFLIQRRYAAAARCRSQEAQRHSSSQFTGDVDSKRIMDRTNGLLAGPLEKHAAGSDDCDNRTQASCLTSDLIRIDGVQRLSNGAASSLSPQSITTDPIRPLTLTCSGPSGPNRKISFLKGTPELTRRGFVRRRQ
jgi:hypothetical protein